MHKRALVVGVVGDDLKVIPLISDACLNCHSLCLYRGNPKTVANDRHLPIKTGAVIEIGTPPIIYALSRLIALLFPLGAALVSFFLFPDVLPYLQSHLEIKNLPQELLKAGFLFGMFLLSVGIVLLISRSNFHIFRLEVRRVVSL